MVAGCSGTPSATPLVTTSVVSPTTPPDTPIATTSAVSPTTSSTTPPDTTDGFNTVLSQLQFKPGLLSWQSLLSWQVGANNKPSFTLLPQPGPDGTITLFTVGNFAFKILPMSFDALNRTRGPLDRSTDEFDALIAQYTQVLEDNPQDYETCIQLAGLYIDRGNPGDAEQAIRYSGQAIEISEGDPAAYYARGVVYVKQGESEKAIQDLQTVLRQRIDGMKGIYYIIGMTEHKAGHTDKAIEAFEKVRAIEPGFADTDEILETLYGLRSGT
jgi:tetratricopeptide (TPR) repeat protein